MELDTKRLLSALEGLIQDGTRKDLLRRIEKTYSAPQFTRKEAARRLERRLGSWDWRNDAPVESRLKNKVARGVRAKRVVGCDEEERVIAHALAITHGDGQFTVLPNGAVCATQSNGWTKEKVRIFISGLSPLIDEAADIINQMTDGKGGRFFFTQDDTFIDAKDRLVFLSVIPDASEPETLNDQDDWRIGNRSAPNTGRPAQFEG